MAVCWNAFSVFYPVYFHTFAWHRESSRTDTKQHHRSKEIRGIYLMLFILHNEKLHRIYEIISLVCFCSEITLFSQRGFKNVYFW